MNGSCYSFNAKNPIHIFQVQCMLALSLMNEGIPLEDFMFVPLPDFPHDDNAWKQHITNMPHFSAVNAVASGNDSVLSVFKNDNNLVKIQPDSIIENMIPISATVLREAIRDNDIETWVKYAAFGTKLFIAQTGGFHRIRNAMLDNEADYVPGRQSVDLFTFVWNGVDWSVVLGNRRSDKENFPGILATTGGGIEDYESPIQAALREAEEENKIRYRILNLLTLPTEISVHDKLSHLHFVGMYSSTDPRLAGNEGGSSLCFMTIYDGSAQKLAMQLRSESDLVNVRLVRVTDALKQGLAYQQTEMLNDAYRMLEQLRR
jgi:ADP-ribose pyrophosphatase YjhB (NUDIX family)